MSEYLAVTIFILSISLVLFIVPFLIRFSKDEFANNLIRRGFWTVFLYTMANNAGIMHTLITAAGLALNRDIINYMYLLSMAGWVMMGFMGFMCIIDLIKYHYYKKNKIRMGE